MKELAAFFIAGMICGSILTVAVCMGKIDKLNVQLGQLSFMIQGLNGGKQ